MSLSIPALLGSIPSPADGSIDLGPIELHAYGVILAIAIVVAAVFAERRWKSWGHDPKQWQDVVVVAVISGIIGARLYHVLTDYEKFEGDWLKALEIWNGGLAIWGAVLGGVAGIVVVCRIKKYDTLGFLDALAPALVLAQAIGRFGNYFNQELFGEPSTLPWALEIDPVNRPVGFERFATFHPTFLYEALFCLALMGALLWAERHWRLRRGQTFALYVVGYPIGRFWLEQLRIDDARLVLGLRVNSWAALAAVVGGLLWFRWLGSHSSVDDEKYEHLGAGTPTSTG